MLQTIEDGVAPVKGIIYKTILNVYILKLFFFYWVYLIK